MLEFVLEYPTFSFVVGYFVVGLFVCLKLLHRPRRFSWAEFFNPLKGWGSPNRSEDFLQMVFWSAPFWPLIVGLRILFRDSDESDDQEPE